jgi:GNAT superfamily N-acetyltransferase
MLRLAIFDDLEEIYRFDHLARSEEWRRQCIQAAMERGECWDVKSARVLLGYAIMNYSFFRRGFVPLLYVHPSHRRKGVAGQLFDELEAHCRSERIFTSTNLSNAAMHAFLTNRRYVLISIIQQLDEGDREIFYSKQLG